MNISEEMKERAKEVDNLPFEEKTTGAYDLTSFVPKVEALEIENENFDNENKLLKQQNKELIESLKKMILIDCHFCHSKPCKRYENYNCDLVGKEIKLLEEIFNKKWEDIINES